MQKEKAYWIRAKAELNTQKEKDEFIFWVINELQDYIKIKNYGK